MAAKANLSLRPSSASDAEAEEAIRGRYRLCVDLASGGMGTVYLACASGPAGFGKLVALKQIHPHLAKRPEFVKMFLEEARIASLLNHPNVCNVLDFGEDRGSYFLTMEYLMGEPLGFVRSRVARTSSLRNSPRYPCFVARLVADACEGLHAAHELKNAQGEDLELVHRDVSANNVFVTYDGSVRVMDFGVARVADRVQQTEAGRVKGKLAYMAPEQMQGLPVDRRADVWSLGVLLWELLASRRLFRRSNDAETVLAVTTEKVPSLLDVRDDVPPALVEIVKRALSRVREDRYPTARALGRELVRFISDQPEPFGAAEVSDWMRGLFPKEMAEKETLSRRAMELGRRPPEQSGETLIPFVGASTPAGATPSGTFGVGPRAPHPVTPKPQRRSVALGLLAISLLGTWIVVESREQSSQGNAASAAAPATTSPAIHSAPPPPTASAPRPVAEEPIQSVAAGSPDRSKHRSTAEPAVLPTEPSAAVERAATKTRRPSRRPRDPANTSPIPQAKGFVNLATPGAWAEVYLGGRRLGQAPGRFALPAGRHRLTVRPFGGEPSHSVRVLVKPNAVSRVRVDVR